MARLAWWPGILVELMRRVFFAAALLLTSCSHTDEVDVSAAISLQDALREVAAASHQNVVFNFAGSNVLARQIRKGAPVDVFLPADEKTMQSVRDLVETPMPLLSNQLVVVSNMPLHVLADLQRCSRIALADPRAVPAGVYAREALQAAGLWSALQPRVIPAENVRAALAAVESGNVDAAIVYATDARMARKTKVAFAITPGPRIVYPAAAVRGAAHSNEAHRFLDFLRTPRAATIFRRYGFRVIPRGDAGAPAA